MREQEFRARDKVVQKMARGGLCEKNLTKGTEQGISQRDGDFSFQTHGEREEGMAERTAARGRESLRHDRNGYAGRAERDGEWYGESSVSRETTGGRTLTATGNGGISEQPQKRGETYGAVLDGRQEERHHTHPDSVQPDKPGQNGTVAGQGMDSGRNSAGYHDVRTGKGSKGYRGMETGGRNRNGETFRYLDDFQGKRQAADTGQHNSHRRRGKLPVYNPGETAAETVSVRNSCGMEQTDESRESSLVYPEIERNGEGEEHKETAGNMPPESGRQRMSAAIEQQRRRKVQRTHAKAWRENDSLSGSSSRNSEISGKSTEAGFRRPEEQKPEPFRRKDGIESRKFPKVEERAEAAGKESDSASGDSFRNSNTAGKREKAEFRRLEKQKPEGMRSVKKKSEPSREKEKPVPRKSIRAERHAAAAKSRLRETAADTSGHFGEKQESKNEDSGGSGKNRGSRKRRLRFEPGSVPEKPEESLLKRTGGGLVHTAQTAAVGKLHQKIREVEQDNTGVESAHKAEAVVERAAGRAYRIRRERLRSRPYRAMKRAEKQAMMVERNTALKKLQEEYPQLQKKSLANWVQKQKIKRKYAAAAREASKGAGHSARFLSATGHIFRQVAEHVKKKAGGTAVGIILAGVLLFSLCGSLFTSCSSLFTGAGSSLMSACYLAEDGEISNAELRYTELETDLQMDIAGTEWQHSGYDEYRYNIGEIGHNPYELMGYLSAVFNDFTYAQVEPELDRLFGLQYRLTREEVTETRTYLDEEGEEQEYEWRILKTVLSVRPLSEILSGSLAEGDQTERYGIYMQTYGGRQYFGNPFDFSWLGSVTSSYGYRVHPVSGGRDLHRGVDIGAAWGTPIRAILDGQVASAGEAGDYGLCIVIAGEDGYQSRYAHCSSLAVSAGQEVRKGDIVAYVGDTGESTGTHLHLEVLHDGEYLNPFYFVENGGGGYTAGGNAAGRPQFPADPGTPMGDGTFEAVRTEAERHMGRPYVWGGSSPETSFDCSGYVSWVINQSGAGSVGRQTAQGLCNLCTPVAWEDLRPGDLVFFTGTYSSLTPVSHVGIYMGGGRMAHAGDPIGYANIGSSRYWKEHFYCGGRLP